MSNKTVSFYMEQELQKYMTPEAKNFFLCSWYRYMFPYIPFDTGVLASTTAMSNEKISIDESMELGLESIRSNPQNVIHFKAPYASTQYDGLNFNFRTDQHPLACARWAEVAANLHGEEIINELKRYVRSEK